MKSVFFFVHSKIFLFILFTYINMFLFPSFLLWLASLVLLPFLWPHSFLYIDFIYAVKYFSFPQKWENVCDEVMNTLQHYNIKTWIFFSHTLRSLRFLLYQIINSISCIETLRRKPKLLSHPYFFSFLSHFGIKSTLACCKADGWLHIFTCLYCVVRQLQ